MKFLTVSIISTVIILGVTGLTVEFVKKFLQEKASGEMKPCCPREMKESSEDNHKESDKEQKLCENRSRRDRAKMKIHFLSEFLNTPLFGILLSLVAFQIGTLLYKKTRFSIS